MLDCYLLLPCSFSCYWAQFLMAHLEFLTMAHFSNSLLVELDKVLGINASHRVENAIKFFPYNLYQISNVYTLKSNFQGSYLVGRVQLHTDNTNFSFAWVLNHILNITFFFCLSFSLSTLIELNICFSTFIFLQRLTKEEISRQIFKINWFGGILIY